MIQPDYSLYLVTDRGLSCGRSLVGVVEEAVAGGVTCVQLREKNCSTRQFVEEGLALQKILIPENIPLIVNDLFSYHLVQDARHLHQPPWQHQRDHLQ